jgi:hypothetical protein
VYQPTTAQTSAPAPVATARPDAYTVDRQGVILLGGFSYVDSDRSQYLEALVPLPLPFARRFKLALRGGFAIEYHYDFISQESAKLLGYLLLPALQNDWRLPIESERGDFVVAAEAGVGFGQFWAKLPAAPYMPPNWESVSIAVARVATSMQFFAHSGLVVMVQPVGISVPLNEPKPPSPRWTVSAETAFELAIAAGYRFR